MKFFATMSESDQRPDFIWSQEFQTAGERKYFSKYRGEFMRYRVNCFRHKDRRKGGSFRSLMPVLPIVLVELEPETD